MVTGNVSDNGLIFQERFKKLVGKSTQEEVAQKINTSRQNVGNWLKGKSRPDIYALAEISKGFNVSTDYLLGLTDIKSTDIKIKDICEYTGLDENTVITLQKIKSNDSCEKELILKIISLMLNEFANDKELK